MKPRIALLVFLALAASATAREIETEWAYHAAIDADRPAELVPGESFAFLANGSTEISASAPVELYLLTSHDFAGELDEQIFVRWWDGSMSHWIMGQWVKNIVFGDDSPNGRFHGQPDAGSFMADLWKVEIPAEITQPGPNYYAIQIKGFLDGVSEERFLLNRPGGDFSRTNLLGQIWSASEEFDGQDWRIDVLP